MRKPQKVLAIFDYGATRSTATPDELAARWAKGMSLDAQYSRVDRVLVKRSERQAEIAVTSGEERVIAVLSYDKDPEFGWRLKSVSGAPPRKLLPPYFPRDLAEVVESGSTTSARSPAVGF